MTQTVEEKNKALVLEAFETLFNKKDYAAAERFWSPSYIQHSKHIPPGRDGLFGLIKSVPETMRYENGAILAEGNLLMLHGRITGLGLPANWIAVDIVRLENGHLAEHWDVIEDEATRETSVSGLPMFRAGISVGMIQRSLGVYSSATKWTPSVVVWKRRQSLGTGERKMLNAQNRRIK
jgi:predicted SnoaL-like aldol condensation-catalyzing enzyme